MLSGRGAGVAAARDERAVAVLDHVEHARRDPLLVDEAAVDAQPLGQRHAVRLQAAADLQRRRERVLGRDVVAVGGQAAEVGRAGGDQLRPPVGEVRRDLDADAGHQAARLGDEPLHVRERDRRGPRRGAVVRMGVQPGAPELLGRLGGDLRRLLAVVAAVRDEVLQDHLLQVVEAGERLQRGHPVRLGLADADQDPAGERDPQLLGGGDRGQPLLGVLGRRALVGDEVRVDGLEHQALRGGDRAQPREVGAAEDAEVRVRQHAALERPLAGPDDVGGEVLVAERVQPLAYAGVVVGRLAGEHEQLLDAAAGGAVDQPLDLGRLLQVRLVRRERAVLAVAAASTRQRQRQVAGERDAAAHRAEDTGVAIMSGRARTAHPDLRPRAGVRRLRRDHRQRPPGRGGDAAARLRAERRPRGDLRRHVAGVRRGRGRRARRARARRLDRRAAPAPGRPRRHGDPRHPRPGAGAREGARHRRRDGAAAAAAGVGAGAARRAAPARPRRAAASASAACRRTWPCSTRWSRATAATPAAVRTTTIGFEAVRAMLAERVDAATAFWNVEGVALRERRPDVREFRVDDFGAPAYPELVLCVTRSALTEKARGRAGDGPRPAARLHAGPERPGERGDRAASTPTPASRARPPRRRSTPSPPPGRPAPAPTASCAATSCASGRTGTSSSGSCRSRSTSTARSTSRSSARSANP